MRGIQVTSIVISNNAQLGLNVSQVVNDTRALGELHNANGSAVTEKVSDSAVNIQTYLNNLQADSLITSIVVSNNVALTLTAAEVVNDATALSEVSNKNGGTVTFTVSDIAANISTYLNQLAASPEFSKISTITVSDNGSVVLSAAQIASDAAVLAKLVNQNSSAYTLTVNDTAANLSGAEFDALNGNSHVTSIVISDNAAITLTVSEFTNDTHALGELSNANGQPYSIVISDTASNVGSDLSVLNGNSHVTKIIVSDSGSGGSITLSASQAAGDSTALGELYQANGTSRFLVKISDTGSNISSNLNALAGLTSDFSTITISDNSAISVSVAQFLADSTLFGELHNANGSLYALSISDTAADISAQITALATQGHVSTVYVTDNGVVTATYAQLNQYSGFLQNKIQGVHYLDIINVTGQVYTSFTETINANHQITQQDFYNANGGLILETHWTYNNDGTAQVQGIDVVGKPYASYIQNLDTHLRISTATYYNSDGSVYDNVSFTYNQDGSSTESITGLQGITLETLSFDTHGATANEFVFYANNQETVYFYESGQSYTSNGEYTALNVNAGTNDSFTFTGHFNVVGVYGYLPGSDTIYFDHNDFANIAAVEAATTANGNNTVITLDANDRIVLHGITVAQFEAHTSDWHFI